MTAKKCPRCATALNLVGEKLSCPSCGLTLVRKSKGDPTAVVTQPTPAALPTLDFSDPVAPARRKSPSMTPTFVLAGTALFLLVGTVLTGYAFSLTFSTPAETTRTPPPTEKPTPPEPPAAPSEDWRVTLNNLREIIVAPPTTPTEPIVDTTPSGSPKVNEAIDKGIAWLKKNGRSRPNGVALVGLTLLECGVPANDSTIEHAAKYVRDTAGKATATYEIATHIWFLDRLGQEQDKPLIRRLALRLIANQKTMAGWDYQCRKLLSEAEENQLVAILQSKPLPATWRQEMSAAVGRGDDSRKPVRPPVRTAPEPGLDELPLLKWDPSKPLEMRQTSHEDNSLAQFAILSLWAARKHGVPVERCLAFVEARFRNFQNPDGSWGYTLRSTSRRDSMTCAGLLGLAVGRGLGQQTGPVGEVKDAAIEKGLIYLGEIVRRGNMTPEDRRAAEQELQQLTAKLQSTRDAKERAALAARITKLRQSLNPAARGGNVVGADAWGDIYFLWSMERMAVVYDLKTIAGKDWYAWGSEALIRTQSPDGSWHAGHSGVPDTCFALLFLKRVNVVKDLTEQLKLLGKVKDPGSARPDVVLPGEVVRPDDR